MPVDHLNTAPDGLRALHSVSRLISVLPALCLPLSGQMDELPRNDFFFSTAARGSRIQLYFLNTRYFAPITE